MKVYQCDRCKKIYERRRLVNGEPYITHLHFIDAINNAPTVEPTFGLFKEMLCEECGKRPHGEWIPVSERLPDKNMACLVSVGDLHLTQIAVYSDLMGTISHKIFYQGEYGKNNFQNITEYVRAWQPLPEPYKEVEE